MTSKTSYPSPFGTMTVVASSTGIQEIFFGDKKSFDIEEKETKIHKLANSQLSEYFQGERKKFTLPLEPVGTEFQHQVWKALQEIPYGDHWSYKDVAVFIGNPKSSRAVGGANNKNPIPIVIPCHRVVGANGNMVGYFYDISMKEKLLELEQKNK